jgi:hypothetical protein
MTTDRDQALRHLQGRVEREPFFLGHALATYRRSNSVSEQQLADFLVCSIGSISRLMLCRLPRDDSKNFKEDVRRVAAFAECSPDRLAALIREVAAIASLEEPLDASEGVLLAARDRRPGDSTDGEPKD